MKLYSRKELSKEFVKELDTLFLPVQDDYTFFELLNHCLSCIRGHCLMNKKTKIVEARHPLLQCLVHDKEQTSFHIQELPGILQQYITKSMVA